MFLGLNRRVGQSPPSCSSHPDVHEQKRALLPYKLPNINIFSFSFQPVYFCKLKCEVLKNHIVCNIFNGSQALLLASLIKSTRPQKSASTSVNSDPLHSLFTASFSEFHKYSQSSGKPSDFSSIKASCTIFSDICWFTDPLFREQLRSGLT